MSWFALFDTNVRKWPGRRVRKPLIEVLAEIMYTAQIVAEVLKGFAVGTHLFFTSGPAVPYVSFSRPISSEVWSFFDIKYGFTGVRAKGNVYVPVSAVPTVRIIQPFTVNVLPYFEIKYGFPVVRAKGNIYVPAYAGRIIRIIQPFTANVFANHYVTTLIKPIYPLTANVYPYMYIKYEFKRQSMGYNTYAVYSLGTGTKIINNTQPYFLVGIINAPKNVRARSEFEITWLISNYGGAEGTYIFYVNVKNGPTVYKETGTLGPQASRAIVTAHTAPAQSGRINIIACIYKTDAYTADDCAEVVIDVY